MTRSRSAALRGARLALAAALAASLALPAAAAAPARDGAKDFDFHLGAWHTHIRRLVHPLSGSQEWAELDGRMFTRAAWDGAQLETIEAKGPGGAVENSLTFFLYDTAAHQWTVRFADRAEGVLSTPLIGEFKDGRGEFIDQEPYHGRNILVRAIWSKVTPTTHHFEQAFSDDNGKTWEINFSADLTKE